MHEVKVKGRDRFVRERHRRREVLPVHYKIGEPPLFKISPEISNAQKIPYYAIYFVGLN